MATNDTELVSEVRSLTDYDSGILTDSELDSLLAIAKREIETEVGEDSLDFYANARRERALFWLTCFFAKIKTGEYEGMDLTVSEIEMNKIPEGDEGRIWLTQFEKRLKQIVAGNKTYISNISRNNRLYGDN